MDKRTKNILTYAIGRDLAGLVESYLIPHWFHLHQIKTALVFKNINKYRWFIYTVQRADKKYWKHRNILLGLPTWFGEYYPRQLANNKLKTLYRRRAQHIPKFN